MIKSKNPFQHIYNTLHRRHDESLYRRQTTSRHSYPATAEEKQLLLLTVAAAQVIEIHVATTKKRGLLLKMKGCS